MTIIDVSDLLIYLGKASTATAADRARAALLIPLADSAIKNHLGYNVNQATYTHFLPNKAMYGQSTQYVDVVNNRIQTDGWSGTTILALPELPVRSIVNIWSNMAALGGQGPDDFPETSKLVVGTDCYLDNDENGVCWTGHVLRFYNTWPARPRAVKVEYVAGFTPAELDGNAPIGRRNPGSIKLAALMAAAAEFKQSEVWEESNSGAIVGEKLGDYSVTYAAAIAAYFSGMTQITIPPRAQALLQPFVKVQR